MLRVELHAHTADDPVDAIPHTTGQLIDRAAALGYQAVAVTLHDRQLDLAPWRAYAAARGVVLIPGVERTIHGRHLLLLNFPPVAERVTDFSDVRALKEQFEGLVVAPHPFYPGGTCLGRLMDEHADVFDAVEFTYFYTRGSARFNDRAVRWAAAHGRPVVGNGDVHRLYQLGRTCSLVDAEPDAGAIVRAVRAGRVQVETAPITVAEATRYFSSLMTARWAQSWRDLTRTTAGQPQRAA